MKILTLSLVVGLSILTTLIGWGQISSESTIHRPSGYVQPFDLNLMRDVTTQKQKVYDERYEQISGRLKRIRKDIERLDELEAPKLDDIVNIYNIMVEGLRQGQNLTDNDRFYKWNDYMDSLESMIDDAFDAARSTTRRTSENPNTSSNTYSTPSHSNSAQKGSAIGKRIEVYAGAVIREGTEFKDKEVAVVDITDTDKLTVLADTQHAYYVKYRTKVGYIQKHMVKRIID